MRLPSTYLALGELQRTLVPANLEELHETLLVGSAADDIADEVANVLHASTDLLREYDWKEATVSESFRRKSPSRRMPENRADTHPLALSGTRSQLTLGDDVPLLKSNRDARHCCRVRCSFAARSKKGRLAVEKSLLKLDSAWHECVG